MLYFFAFIILIQCVFWIGFARILFYQDSKPQKTTQNPISILVCCHNELENLEKLIPIILKQENIIFELIVVNDRSTDNTLAYLKAIEDQRLQIITITHTPSHWNPKKYALTQGIAQAKYNHLLLTDADCEPASLEWAKEMQNKIVQDKSIVLGYSPYFKEKGILNAFIQFETLMTAIQYFNFALWGLPYMGVGRNLMYAKSLFLETQGFDKHQNITGGDDDLFIGKVANLHNTNICISKESFVYSFPKKTWQTWYKQKIRHLSVGVYYKPKIKILLGLLNFSQIFFWLIFMVLLCNASNYIAIWVLFTLRMALVWILINMIGRKLQTKIPFLAIPFFDILFSLYIFMIGLKAITSKKIQWN